jgi:hypothetical protein
MNQGALNFSETGLTAIVTLVGGLEPSIIPTLVNVVKIISSADGGVGQLFF